MAMVYRVELAWLRGRQASVPRLLNLPATLGVTTPTATLLSLIALARHHIFGTSALLTRRRAQEPTALSTIGHGLWMALGATLASLVRSQVAARLKRCACGAAARSSAPFSVFPRIHSLIFPKEQAPFFSGFNFSVLYSRKYRPRKLKEKT